MPFYKIAKDSLLERVPILQNADDPELSAALKRMAIIIQNDTIFKETHSEGKEWPIKDVQMEISMDVQVKQEPTELNLPTNGEMEIDEYGEGSSRTPPKTKFKTKKFYCIECECNFDCMSELDSHIQEIHNAQFLCNKQCGRSFANYALYETHFKRCAIPQKCKKCYKTFLPRNYTLLISHKKSCIAATLECKELNKLKKPCNKLFASEKLYKSHMEHMHPEINIRPLSSRLKK